MEINNNINNSLENNLNKNIELKQNNFLESNLGKIINTAINVGLRFVLPDLIEDEVIKVKDNIMEEGLKEGIKTTISEGINIGKSAIGIFTGKFENINQMQDAVKKGGIINKISNIFDIALNTANKKGKISNNTTNLIKKSKNTIFNNISTNIEDLMTDQIDLVEKLNKYSKNWKSYFEEKDFLGMEKEYKKIKNIFNKIAPLETVINQSRKIENLHNLIKNNGQNFNLTQDEIKLAEML